MTTLPDVPWMIEGGAKHTVQVARNVSFMAAGGTEGIVLGADLEVRETAVPGSNIRVFPGTAAVLNRAAGAYEEMYVARVGAETEVAIAPTDGVDGRSDMLALARIDIPISTATIDQSMITDLRVMANAVNQRQAEIFTPTVLDTLTSGTYENWPDEVNMLVDIPSWATHVRAKAILAGVRLGDAGNNGGAGWDVAGDLRFSLGSNPSQATTYKGESEDGRIRQALVVAAPKMAVPVADRGKVGVSLRVEGRKNSGSTSIEVTDTSTVHVEVEFINEPESNV